MMNSRTSSNAFWCKNPSEEESCPVQLCSTHSFSNGMHAFSKSSSTFGSVSSTAVSMMVSITERNPIVKCLLYSDTPLPLVCLFFSISLARTRSFRLSLIKPTLGRLIRVKSSELCANLTRTIRCGSPPFERVV